MSSIFISLYNYLKNHRLGCHVLLAVLMMFFAFCSFQIRIEEDITRFFPNDKKVEKINQVFQQSKFAEKLVVMVSLTDTNAGPQPDSLIRYTDELIAKVEADLKPYIKQVRYKVDDEAAFEMFNAIYDYLPVFLSESDYSILDSLTKQEAVQSTLDHDYRQLVSPAGMFFKKMILRDPLGISAPVLKKLQELQYDPNFELYDSYILTKDLKHLVFFISPSNPPFETKANKKFVEGLRNVIQQTSASHSAVRATFFGGTAVAVGNAERMTTDTFITVSAMIMLLLILFIWFFRRKRAPILVLIPVLFGGLFSLTCIYFIKGSVSAIALAAGSIVLGIAVNYSLHFIAHLKHTQSISQTIRDLAQPMTIGSTTTILAFFCLQFTNAELLRDVGLFAGFSLVGAALCTLVFLPHLVSEQAFGKKDGDHDHLFERFTIPQKVNKYIIAAIFILTPVLFYFARDVKFNSDMMRFNYMSEDLKKAETELYAISDFSLNSVYVVTSGATLEEALQHNERTSRKVKELQQEQKIKESLSVSSFIISDSLQKVRIERWNAYWTPERKEQVLAATKQEATRLKFSPGAFAGFDSLLNRRYVPAPKSTLEKIRLQYFDDYITEKPGGTTVVTLVKVDPRDRESVLSEINETNQAVAVDRQMLTSMFVEYVNADFTFIVTFTSILVFVVLLISYGRIELTLITFIPMLIAWIWILGIMALLGIEFNIVNVMISTFIFGLGDDYSIFIMDGLQQEYKTGRKNLASYKTSILLSALTTIAGLGVLIFAQHPALKSIAAISIIGIVCVFLISQTLEPFLFSFFISSRTKKGFNPATLKGVLISTVAFTVFVVGSILLTITGFVLIKVIPFRREQMKLVYHTLLSKFTGFLFYMMANVKKRMINKDPGFFSRPRVIISNHQSFIDILATSMLHPKIILLTNKWVWHSPVFGEVVKLADYYPVMEGVEESLGHLEKKAKEGYSIMIFPEGTRSTDGKIRRFHRGAFYIAEKLKLDILPLLIDGTNPAMRKGDFYLNDTTITHKFLPLISHDDASWGTNYSERTKTVSRYFKKEFKKLQGQTRTTKFYRPQLISNYIYKGPVLEWYLRIKLRLEKNYEPLVKMIPANASILDLGCGYGFLAYMLSFLSEDRIITGVDYDEDKINTANNCYAKSERINFICADISTFSLQSYDVILLTDVLHYLTPEEQTKVLERCIHALNPGGQLIVRDANRDLQGRHRGTRLTELMSVKILKFNKSANELYYISGETIMRMANAFRMETEVIDDSKYTSNIIFVMKKSTQVYAGV